MVYETVCFNPIPEAHGLKRGLFKKKKKKLHKRPLEWLKQEIEGEQILYDQTTEVDKVLEKGQLHQFSDCMATPPADWSLYFYKVFNDKL